MKLVAATDFRNPRPDAIDHSERVNDNHIHKGARFSIGDDLPLEKLSAADKRLVAELNTAGRIVSADQKEKVEAIDKEVAAEKKKAQAVKPAEAKK